MFFFGKNLNSKHKVTLCLVAVSILTSYVTFFHLGRPVLEYLPNGKTNVNVTKIDLVFGILVKMLVLCIFRKF